MKTKQKYLIATTTIIISAGLFLYFNNSVRSASYSFFQSDWSGGASADTAVHPGDASDWNEYSFADNIVATGTAGQISLSTTTASWAQTETVDFSLGTFSGATAVFDKVVLIKHIGAECTAGAECAGGYCDGNGYCSTCESFTYSGQTYDTVIIGEQCWMAENLNVGTMVNSVNTGISHTDVSNNGVIQKYCYSNTASYCTTDGGLYDWNEAMGYVTTNGAQGICATGWHIPTDDELYILESGLATSTCSASRLNTFDCSPAGTRLRDGGDTGFNGLFTGFRFNQGNFLNRGAYGYFWASTVSSTLALRRNLSPTETGVYRHTYEKVTGFPVRCIKN